MIWRSLNCQVLMAEVEMRDKLEDEWLAKENKQVDRAQWVRKSRQQHMVGFDSMAKDLIAERKVVKRFELLPKELADRGTDV
jgi:hypothetical protein